MVPAADSRRGGGGWGGENRGGEGRHSTVNREVINNVKKLELKNLDPVWQVCHHQVVLLG